MPGFVSLWLLLFSAHTLFWPMLWTSTSLSPKLFTKWVMWTSAVTWFNTIRSKVFQTGFQSETIGLQYPKPYLLNWLVWIYLWVWRGQIWLWGTTTINKQQTTNNKHQTTNNNQQRNKNNQQQTSTTTNNNNYYYYNNYNNYNNYYYYNYYYCCYYFFFYYWGIGDELLPQRLGQHQGHLWMSSASGRHTPAAANEGFCGLPPRPPCEQGRPCFWGPGHPQITD